VDLIAEKPDQQIGGITGDEAEASEWQSYSQSPELVCKAVLATLEDNNWRVTAELPSLRALNAEKTPKSAHELALPVMDASDGGSLLCIAMRPRKPPPLRQWEDERRHCERGVRKFRRALDRALGVS
jgi:hypothetical protein